MALGPRLDLRTSQTLVISPQLQAAIRLLALSNLELQAELAAELDRNPLIELDDETGPSDAEGAEAAVDVEMEPPSGLDGELATLSDEARAADQDVDYIEERFHHDCATDTGRASGPAEGEDWSLDQIAEGEASLQEVLSRQAEGLPPRIRAIVLALIAELDDAGYLTESLERIAERLSAPLEEAEAALATLQGFEPTGVGARTLAECLAIQAREADRYDPCMQAMIANLDLVARGDLAQLRRLCNVDSEDLADMLRELRRYNPKPGLIHGSARAIHVVPDVLVRQDRRGAWHVELNRSTLPRVIVNRRYQAELKARERKRPDRQFVDQCVQQAGWLVRALDQRATTILKVATALVGAQRGFFEHGVARLRPLTLRQIAEEVGLHESTVSRVTSNKYLSCARGVFELKYFFTTGIHATSGEDASAESVRQRIRALIEAEPPLKPLSDDKLVEKLRAEGIELARRTVTKYREALHIPSSFDRRRRALVDAA